MRVRSRRSRFIARVTLFAAAATIASSIAAPGGALAVGRVHTVTLGVGHAAALAAASGQLPTAAGRRPSPQPRVARTLASVPQTYAPAVERAIAAAGLLVAALGAGGLLGGWLLEFVGKSSRTRGQPRTGALAA